MWDFSNSASSQLYANLRVVVDKLDSDLTFFMQQVKSHQYEQTVKSKKKEMKMELIKQDDLLSVIEPFVRITANH